MTDEPRTWRHVVLDAMSDIDEMTAAGATVDHAVLVVAFTHPDDTKEGHVGSVGWYATTGPAWGHAGLLRETARRINGPIPPEEGEGP